ncbi:MAG TPA: hypothetical protein VKA46_00225 [Gemmataceae bacterium]|nr:hypothetical protein [Gemmataceae bacterium]
MATHVLTIPDWHPARLNQLLTQHWRPRYRLKRADAALVATYAHLTGIPPATGRRRVLLRITLGPRQRAGDPDAYWKSLLDALKAARLLVDDNRQGVELGPVTFDRGPARATAITLENLGPADRAAHHRSRRGAGRAASGRWQAS